MKKLTIILAAAVLSVVTANAQGRGRGSASASSSVHNNAATSADRDKGKDRAEDVGRGKKKGLTKTGHPRHRSASKRRFH